MEINNDLPTCESCWKECEEQLFDGVNYVCADCYERNEVINEDHDAREKKLFDMGVIECSKQLRLRRK